jgi:hypothetical protein
MSLLEMRNLARNESVPREVVVQIDKELQPAPPVFFPRVRDGRRIRGNVLGNFRARWLSTDRRADLSVNRQTAEPPELKIAGDTCQQHDCTHNSIGSTLLPRSMLVHPIF